MSLRFPSSIPVEVTVAWHSWKTTEAQMEGNYIQHYLIFTHTVTILQNNVDCSNNLIPAFYKQLSSVVSELPERTSWIIWKCIKRNFIFIRSVYLCKGFNDGNWIPWYVCFGKWLQAVIKGGALLWSSKTRDINLLSTPHLFVPFNSEIHTHLVRGNMSESTLNHIYR